MEQFLISFLSAIIAVSLFASMHSFLDQNSTNKWPDKPYTIVFETVTEADVKKCRSDDNCMDIMSLDELPEIDLTRLRKIK